MSSPAADATPETIGWTVRALTAADRDLLRHFVAHEAVVPIRSPRDLTRRLAPDRRILAVQDGSEPLAFVNIALTRAFPRRLEQILSGPVLKGAPRFATFYGITRASDSVRGKGGLLLRAALAAVQHEHPTVHPVTLSPVPGLRNWVARALADAGHSELVAWLDAMARRVGGGLDPDGEALLFEVARRYLAAWSPPASTTAERPARRTDPVARFHLNNGAALRRILVGADPSWHGLQQSWGVMASYDYATVGATVTTADAAGLEPSKDPKAHDDSSTSAVVDLLVAAADTVEAA